MKCHESINYAFSNYVNITLHRIVAHRHVAKHELRNTPYNNRVTVGNGVMQPVARQLKQLNYNNGNGGDFCMVRAEELS
jgi:hypothetical protein